MRKSIILASLLGLAFNSGLLAANKPAQPKKAKAQTAYQKEMDKKKAAAKAKDSKKAVKGSKQVAPKAAKAKTTKKAATAQAAVKKQEPTAYRKAAKPATKKAPVAKKAEDSKWSLAGLTGAATGYRANKGEVAEINKENKHYGPRNWHHNFPSGWNKGFTWDTSYGKPLFAGYPVEWWLSNYPEYFKGSLNDEYQQFK